jgi:hypothetical protein
MVYIICSIGVVFSVLFHIFVREPNLDKSLNEKNSLYGSTGQLIIGNVYRCKSPSFSYFESKENKIEHLEQKTDKQTVSKSEKDKIMDGKTNKCWDWFKNINFFKVVRITIY